MNRHYKTLELDKILKLLADQTSIDDAKEMALSLEPQFELEKVKKLLKQTDDAVVLSGKYGTPSFGGAKIVQMHYAEQRRAAVFLQASFYRLPKRLELSVL